MEKGIFKQESLFKSGTIKYYVQIKDRDYAVNNLNELYRTSKHLYSTELNDKHIVNTKRARVKLIGDDKLNKLYPIWSPIPINKEVNIEIIPDPINHTKMCDIML